MFQNDSHLLLSPAASALQSEGKFGGNIGGKPLVKCISFRESASNCVRADPFNNPSSLYTLRRIREYPKLCFPTGETIETLKLKIRKNRFYAQKSIFSDFQLQVSMVSPVGKQSFGYSRMRLTTLYQVSLESLASGTYPLKNRHFKFRQNAKFRFF